MGTEPRNIQPQPASIVAKTYPATVLVTPAAVIERVELSNKLSEYEQIQIADWITERFDDLGAPIKEGPAFIEALYQAFSGRLSSEGFSTLIKLIEQMLQ
ncbi:hypothetical protein [Haliea salexigens]|uniref:hypothetical protein n=1 Tax=Haliea salexigens TaxID=287487 RepID=UPI00047F76CE|nr:hypothetical protein [Haliea salexigens]